MTQQAYNHKANAESVQAERALLIAVHDPHRTEAEREYIEQEMRQLARTAGLSTVEVITQSLRSPNSATHIGSGKVEEIAVRIRQGGEVQVDRRGPDYEAIEIVLFSCDLSPVHQRNLEKALGRRVIDRTELILDIFAQHAVTRDGKIQVELAQLQYIKPRLTGRGKDLSRLGGGIGTRGPGETKLETDLRKIDDRIRRLKIEYQKCRAVGRVQRRNRKRGGLTTIALVGYTNAGKSTLLNRLTKSTVLAENQLFSTLDTTTRRLFLPDGVRILLSDTVGFIENLPDMLLGAFRATLAEVEEADGLIHVLDASAPDAERQIEAVMSVLQELNAVDKPLLTILNKRDAVQDLSVLLSLEHQCHPAIAFSALHDKEMIPVFTAISELASEAREKRSQVARPDESEQDAFMDYMTP